MRTLGSMLPNKQYKIAGETLYIYAPLANRLGLYKIKTELENLSFKYEHPEEYAEIEEKLNATAAERDKVFNDFTAPIRTQLDKMGLKYRILARVKSIYSIWNKMQTKHVPFEEIYDLLAVRIIFEPRNADEELNDCFDIYVSISKIYKPHPDRLRDWVSHPKANGYQALHVTLMGNNGQWIEVQIRSERMNDVAEQGFAAHWKYKEGNTSQKQSNIEGKLQWLRQMMEWEKDLKDPQEFMDALKEDVFSSQVYVFTPKGDVVELPAESTPIDFAYRVHTNVGNKCVGAKIDGRIVPLDYKLQNGNIVEILTSSNSNGPSRDWINIVKTPNAKSRIRQWFKKERREENIQRGTEILEKEFKKYHIPLKDSNIEKYMQQMTKKFNQPTVEDLIATIGYGGIMPAHVVPKIRDLYEKEVKKVQKEQKEEINDIEKHSISDAEYKQKRKKNNSQGIVVKRLDNILIRFAKCCNPLPGDEIIGYVTKGRGVAIHRADCPNANVNGDFFKNRLVDVAWSNSEASKFEAEIQIKAVDRRGIINDITHIIAMDKVSLNGISAKKGKDNVVSVNLLVEVNNIDALNTLMKKIKSIPGVENIYRVIN